MYKFCNYVICFIRFSHNCHALPRVLDFGADCIIEAAGFYGELYVFVSFSKIIEKAFLED